MKTTRENINLRKKHNADRWRNSEVDLFFFKKKASGRLLPTAVLAAFFGKLSKFKKSTRETTVALINPFKLLSVATRQTFQCKYAFLTDSHASRWLLSSVNHQTTLLKKKVTLLRHHAVYWQKLPEKGFRKLPSTRKLSRENGTGFSPAKYCSAKIKSF